MSGGERRKRTKKKQKQSNYQKVETEREKERRKERVENKREERNGYVITKRRPNQRPDTTDGEKNRKKKGERYFAQAREKETA